MNSSQALPDSETVVKKRPLGVWILTTLDVLVLGLLTMILAGLKVVALIRFNATLDGFGANFLGGVTRAFIGEYIFLFLWGLIICLVAHSAWLGRDRARIALLLLVTFNIFLAGAVNGIAVLVSVVLVPLHWWYFWRPSTIAFY